MPLRHKQIIDGVKQKISSLHSALKKIYISIPKNQNIFSTQTLKTLANQIEQHNIKGSSSRAKFC